MKEYRLRDPLELSREKLVGILRGIQEFIYVGPRNLIAPDLYVPDADLGMYIESTMRENGLDPIEVTQKDWSPTGKKRRR